MKNIVRRHICQGSILLSTPGFIAFINENFIPGNIPDKDHLALKELVENPYIVDIFDTLESVIAKDATFF
jgi:hypothetical protein